MFFLAEPISGLPIPRYLEKALFFRTARTRVICPFACDSALFLHTRTPFITPSLPKLPHLRPDLPVIESPPMSCPICGGSRSSLVQKEPASPDPTRSAAYTEREVSVVACSDCSFVYVERDFPENYANVERS